MTLSKLIFKMMGGERYYHNNNRSVTRGRNQFKTIINAKKSNTGKSKASV